MIPHYFQVVCSQKRGAALKLCRDSFSIAVRLSGEVDYAIVYASLVK